MHFPIIHHYERNKEVAFSIETSKNTFSPEEHYKGQRATFQRAMKVTVIVGQCFALNPVLGVSDFDTSNLRFTYFSGRCVYTLFAIVGQAIFLTCFSFIKYFNETSTSVTSNTSLVFYVSNTIITVLFLRLARQWPKLCQYISKIEAADPVIDTTLVKKCNVSCIVILVLAMFEHGLAELSGMVMAADCEPSKVYEAYIVQSFPWINLYVNYTLLLGIITQFLNILCTFNWNFVDIFIISISFYLTSRLEQVNKRIAEVRGKYVPTAFWRNVREDYNRATDLVRRVDKVIGSIVFISFANNLVFICMQLLHTFANGIKATSSCHDPDKRPLHGYEQAVYFTYSFLFLVVRSLAVSLIASQVHTASRQPVYALYEVPSAVYCIEVQRLIEQIHGETVALTGLQFFKVKRGIVLAIAGTIVTYELVLLQFTGVTPTVTPIDDTPYTD
ncbi:gustatory receptor for sugar taste 64e-like [Melitaea cinxia]|uniref:gustatory receptor for sugar taste 64e-like n=1 Tax=Melitaea cinxia TaxID=113334 RepID=UPI001E2743BE|nr:gustatory receptor for sugar taste 64e-like [Melitaea cinxia]